MPKFVKHDDGKFNMLEFLSSKFLVGLAEAKLPLLNLVEPEFVIELANVLGFPCVIRESLRRSRSFLSSGPFIACP